MIVLVHADVGELARIDVQPSVPIGNSADIAKQCPLFISEYMDGDGNDNAIEVCNGGASAVTLADYELLVASNGEAWSDAAPLTLGSEQKRTLAPGATFVVAHPSASAGTLAKADQRDASLSISGNDGIALRCRRSIINDAVGEAYDSEDNAAVLDVQVRRSAAWSERRSRKTRSAWLASTARSKTMCCAGAHL